MNLNEVDNHHIYPLGEEKMHDFDGIECRCNPKIQIVPGAQKIVIHREFKKEELN